MQRARALASLPYTSENQYLMQNICSMFYIEYRWNSSRDGEEGVRGYDRVVFCQCVPPVCICGGYLLISGRDGGRKVRICPSKPSSPGGWSWRGSGAWHFSIAKLCRATSIYSQSRWYVLPQSLGLGVVMFSHVSLVSEGCAAGHSCPGL